MRHPSSLRAQRSNPFLRIKKEWIASSQALLAMTVNHPDTYSRSRGALRPSLARNFHPRKSEGAGNAGCALHPRSCAQCAQKVRAQAYRAAENIRHSLRNGFTAYFELSLVTGFLATIIDGPNRQLDASTGASGPPTSPYALAP